MARQGRRGPWSRGPALWPTHNLRVPGPSQGASRALPLAVENFLGLSLPLPLSLSSFSAPPSSTPSLPLCLSPCPCHFPSSHPPTLSHPPVATVNDLACRGLDKLEEKLPFLQKPSEMVPAPPGCVSAVGGQVGGAGPPLPSPFPDPQYPWPARLWGQIRLRSTQKTPTRLK